MFWSRNKRDTYLLCTHIYRFTVDIIGFQREDHATFKSGSSLMINQGNIKRGIGKHTMKSSPENKCPFVQAFKLKSRNDRRAKVNKH